MKILPSRDIELLMTYERLARALEAMHLNHEQRSERIALIGRMVEAPMSWAAPDFLKWLYPLYHLLLTLYQNHDLHMTHREIKHGLRFFAEVCQEARTDLETIKTNESIRRTRAQWQRLNWDVSIEPPDTPPLATEAEVDEMIAKHIAHEPDEPGEPIGLFADLPEWLRKTDDEGEPEVEQADLSK